MTWPFLTMLLKSAFSSCDDARHLRADVDRLDRFERAGRLDRLDDVAAGQLHGRDGRFRHALAHVVGVGASPEGRENDESQNDFFHNRCRLL